MFNLLDDKYFAFFIYYFSLWGKYIKLKMTNFPCFHASVM